MGVINDIASQIEHNKSLQSLNTLAIPASCAYYLKLLEKQQLPEIIEWAASQNIPWMILGGGSNSILNDRFEGLVIHNQLKGVDITERGDDRIVTAGAGEVWDELVRQCLDQSCYGLENLIFIPGLVGAAPIQNIGAYGVELADRFLSLEGWHVKDQQWQTLTLEDCEFSYRDSVFKHRLKDNFVITSITLRLSAAPLLTLSYPSLQRQLSSDPTPWDVANAVESIRRSKLPDPDHLPNAGSFFKNPIVDPDTFADLQQRFPDIVSFRQDDGRVKLAAGWLIEHCGWKGQQQQGVGVHEKQALVLVNYEGQTADKLLSLAGDIQRDVEKTFAVKLEIEPRVYQ